MALEAAAGALLDAVREERKRRETQQDERRKFKEKVVESLIRANRIDALQAMSFDPWRDDLSTLKPSRQTSPTETFQTLQSQFPGTEFEPSVSIGPHGTTVSYKPRARGRAAAKPPMLTETQAAKTFGGGHPGQPLPGVPYTPAGMNTAQYLIGRGQMESPAASAMRSPGMLEQLKAWLTSRLPQGPPPAQGEGGGDLWQQEAVRILQARGYPVTPENVQSLVQKLRQKYGTGGP